MLRAIALAGLALAAVAAGCGGSAKEAKRPQGYIRPAGAYVAPGCEGKVEDRAPQYVAVTTWANGKQTGNAGKFGAPECGDVIVYVESDETDEVRVPALRIAAKVTPKEPAKLEFHAPVGEYPVRLHRNKVVLLRVVVEKS